MEDIAQVDIFAEPFLLFALGAWAAVLLGFLGQVYDKVSYATRLTFASAILVHIAGTLALWLWAFMNRQSLPADALAFAGLVLPIVGLALFCVGLVRK